MQQNTATFPIDSASAQRPLPLTVSGTSEIGTRVEVSIASARISIHIHVSRKGDTYIPSNELLDASLTHRRIRPNPLSEAYQTMLASEAVLSRDWNTPEEDEAWADL